ncbi:MAG: DUF1566 domain-containing protein [Campylobacterota bacterium]|nr:DUF1566 domain-containing protein [Campylobacterota bacterium]
MRLFNRKIVKKGFVLMTLLCTAGHTATDILDLYMMGVLPAIVANQNEEIDKEKPVLLLNGDTPVFLLLGDKYVEEGAVCQDNFDTSCDAIVGGDEVNSSRIGRYIVTYDAIDSSGNRADTITREVNVEEDPLAVDDFTFADEIGVNHNDWFSSSIVVSGLENEVNVTISSSGYAGQASHSYFTVNDVVDVAEVKNGDVVEVRHLSSNEDNTTLNTVITIGSKSDTFSTRTKASESTKIPLIVGSPNFNANVHEVYSYTPQLSTDYTQFAPATKPFSIENRPVWAEFNVTTGELSGVPTQTTVHQNIKISAYGDDGMDSIVYDLSVESNPPYINATDLSLENPNLIFSFNENADWRSKVTKVALRSCYGQDEAVILNPTDYTFSEGALALHASTSSNVALHIPTMGGGSIEVEATGYENNATGIIDFIADGQYAIQATLTSTDELTELNVDSKTLLLTLSNYLEFNDTTLEVSNFNTWDQDITVSSVVYVTSTEANITLTTDGNDFDINKTLEINISFNELNVCQDVSTNSINIEAIIEAPKNILKTGVTESFVMGDDANYSKGQSRSYAYTDNVNSNPVNQDIVRDNITGLQWQDNAVITEEVYRSFDGDSNWTKAKNYCANLVLVGYDDWRLANNEELLTLVDYGESNVSVDGIFNHVGAYNYWSKDTLVTDDGFGWVISLASGELHYSGKRSQFNAKCVRGVLRENIFIRDNGIVKDISTNLKWEDNNASTRVATFINAVEYCNELVIGDEENWRVPNMNELLSITDYAKEPINITDAFENASDYYYYSSTHGETNSSQYWVVDFDNGGGTYQLSERNYNIRCVSDDNPPAHPTAWIKVVNGTDTDDDPDHVTVGVELHGTTFTDSAVTLIQQNGRISATNGYVYVDETHAYIEENIENLTQDEPLSWTIHESETMYSENITSNTIIIHPETNDTNDANGTVTVGELMWEDTAHVRGEENNVTWSQAYNYCDNLTLGEYTDWRLPHSSMNSETPSSEVIAIRVEAEADSDNTIIEGFNPVYQSEWVTTWTDEFLDDGFYIAMIFQYQVENGDGFPEGAGLNVRCVRDVIQEEK